MEEIFTETEIDREGKVAFASTTSSLAKTAFFYPQSVGHFRCKDDYYTKRKGFRSYLVIYTLSGHGCAVYSGKKYELGSGQVLLMDCYEYQEYFTRKGDTWEFKWVHFNGATSGEYFNHIYRTFGPVIDVKGDKVINCMDAIIKAVRDNDASMEVIASQLIVELLTGIILAGMEKHKENTREQSSEWLPKVLEDISGNYNRDISVDSLAQSAHVSKYHFIRAFKKATGFSPYEYVTRYRIGKAKSLLSGTGESIETVAAEVGFESTSNFIRCFKEFEELTPLKFRKYWKG